MALKARLDRLEATHGARCDGRCTCGVVVALLGAGDPEPEPKRCPRCGGIMASVLIVEEIVEAQPCPE